MACSGSYSDGDRFAEYWCVSITDDERASINVRLRQASTMVHMARQANGACDCTLSEASTEYLQTLTNIIAAVFYNCRCSNLNLTKEEKEMYGTWVREDLVNIRNGNIELCAGETGAEYAVTGWAAQGITEFGRARIIANDMLRNS